MLNVLLESNAARAKRVGGTLTSTLVHATIVAGAIMITAQPSIDARTPSKPPTITWVDIEPRKAPPAPPSHSVLDRTPAPRTPTAPPLPNVDHVPVDLPPIDPSVPVATEPATSFGSAMQRTGSPGDMPGLGGPPGGVVEERYVDRSPRIIGPIVEPTFPARLREHGVKGRVLIQFVVDTGGRAEMSELKIVEASDSLFAQSVRAVLPRFRFSAGEAGGRKVRTLVMLPFDFTLVR